MIPEKADSARLVSTNIAARFIGMSVHWLKASRFRPELDGPPFIKIGRAVRYDLRDLDSWLDGRRYRGTHEFSIRGSGQ